MSGQDQSRAFGRISPPRADWLARAEAEAILDPALPIVDSHHHLWDGAGRYLLDEFAADAGTGHNIVASVLVECGYRNHTDGPKELRPAGEVEFAAAVAREAAADTRIRTRVAAGIVGHADLTLGDRVEPVLEKLIEAAGGRLCGIRHSAGWHEDPAIGNNHHGSGPGLYRREDFHAGLARLTAMGLPLDVLAYFHQHADVITLARACPEASIIINHTGMPMVYGPFASMAREVHAQWLATMRDIATCPNVVVKLGGMMMRLAAVDYIEDPAPPTSEQLARAWRPYIEPCIEMFGASRCMFESNFPVDKMGIGYLSLWNAFKRLAASASSSDRSALFAETATRVYRLEADRLR